MTEDEKKQLTEFVKAIADKAPSPDSRRAWVAYGNFKLKLDEWVFHHGSVEGMYETGIKVYCDLAGL